MNKEIKIKDIKLSDYIIIISEDNIDELIDMLPFGSGFDCKYEYDFKKDKLIINSNFHLMDDNGYYDGYLNFSIVFKNNEKISDIKINVHYTQYQRYHYKLFMNDYILETIDYSLENINEKFIVII